MENTGIRWVYNNRARDGGCAGAGRLDFSEDQVGRVRDFPRAFTSSMSQRPLHQMDNLWRGVGVKAYGLRTDQAVRA